jgi:uncharacterized protein YfkK (UPF0435 family)
MRISHIRSLKIGSIAQKLNIFNVSSLKKNIYRELSKYVLVLVYLPRSFV